MADQYDVAVVGAGPAGSATAPRPPPSGGRPAVFDRLVGVAALLDGVDAGEEGFVLVEATPDGWWYSAPTTAGRMVGMLMTDTDLCRYLRVSIPGHWHERLSATRLTATR